MFHPITSPVATAPRACTTCKKRKRACDKQMPTCSSCIWLQTCCQYDVPIPSATPTRTFAFGLPSSHTDHNPDFTSAAIMNQASQILGSPDNILHISQDYFARIHPWLPFMSRSRTATGQKEIADSLHSVNSVVLLCIMRLVLLAPPFAEVDTLRTPLYRDTKRLLALAETEGPQCLDLIQSRLLMALYEINHGATDEAYVSLGMCSRAGIVLGLDRHLQQQETEHWTRREEEKRTWWAIIILDRFLRQQRPHWPASVGDPKPSDILPVADSEWESQQYSITQKDPPRPCRISVASNVRVGYFARPAQVSHLLGLVLNNVYSPTSDSAFNTQEAEQLRRTLDVYAELLPKEATATECSHYCGVIMMCYSAQLFLEHPSFTREGGMNERTKALTDTMTQMARELNLELELMGSELLRPLSLFAISQVASIYVRQCEVTTEAKYRDGIVVLLQLLGIFEERWRVAGAYKAEILGELQQRAIGL